MKTAHRVIAAMFALCGALRLVGAPPTAVALSTSVEDGTRMLVATVTAGGKPVENAKVTFFAQRTFGRLALGNDTTLDDGTAAVTFPSTMPGNAHGELQLGAEIAGQPATRVRAVLGGGVPFQPNSAQTPRALWSSRAPYLLLGIVAALIATVWGTFTYVVWQLCRIRATATAEGLAIPPFRAGRQVINAQTELLS